MSRHSIKNCLRQVRGTRGAIARTEIRYSRHALVAAALQRALKLANAMEAELLKARRLVRESTKAKRAA